MAKTNTYRVKWPLVESLSLLSAPVMLSLAQSNEVLRQVVPLIQQLLSSVPDNSGRLRDGYDNITSEY